MIYRSRFPDVVVRRAVDQRVRLRGLRRARGRARDDRLPDRVGADRAADRRPGQAAGGLTARGFGAGRVMIIMAPTVPDYIVLFRGVAWAGSTGTTVNPS